MSLFAPQPPRQPQVLTKEQQVAHFKVSTQRTATRVNQMLREQYQDGYDGIWSNAILTPEEALAALGTSAVELFTAHYHLGVFLKALDPTFEPLVPAQAVVSNEDGTVTLAE